MNARLPMTSNGSNIIYIHVLCYMKGDAKEEYQFLTAVEETINETKQTAKFMEVYRMAVE